MGRKRYHEDLEQAKECPTCGKDWKDIYDFCPFCGVKLVEGGIVETTCHNCSGSGEGMYDGSSCSRCGGGGALYGPSDERAEKGTDLKCPDCEETYKRGVNFCPWDGKVLVENTKEVTI